MDTNQALQALIQMQTAVKGQYDALTIAVGIIQGTLETQAIDLENKYKNQIKEKDDSISSLTAIVAEKDAIITDLATPKDSYATDVPNS